MMTFGCVKHEDCPGTLLCYDASAFWAPKDFHNSSFCECSLSWGLVREDSTIGYGCILGPHGVFNLVFSAVVLLICVAVVCYGLFSIRIILQSNKWKWNATSATATLSLTTFSLVAGSRLAYMIETVKPSMKGNLELADAKSYQNGNPAMVFFALAYAFMLYTTSNVPMVWIAVVRSSKKLAELKDAARNIQRYVRAYQFLATIHLIISVFVSGRVGLFMFGINLLMGFIATAVFFSIARRWFRNFIKQLGTRHLVIQKRVEQLTNTVLGLMVVACIVSGTYSVFSIIGIEHFCASGSLCIVIIFDDLTLLTILATEFSCFYYCRLSLGFATPMSFTLTSESSAQSDASPTRPRSRVKPKSSIAESTYMSSVNMSGAAGISQDRFDI